jgi:hypothetical protein
MPFPSPTIPVASRAEVFLGYLDYFRSVLVSKVEALPSDEVRQSRLLSGWTPLELVKHLTFVERRWLVWGFEGVAVEEPWGDSVDGRWQLGEGDTRAVLIDGLRAQAAETRRIVEGNDLAAIGQPGPRWDGREPPTLERILFHLLQEYARHVGHLDIVAEISGGPVGE